MKKEEKDPSSKGLPCSSSILHKAPKQGERVLGGKRQDAEKERERHVGDSLWNQVEKIICIRLQLSLH